MISLFEKSSQPWLVGIFVMSDSARTKCRKLVCFGLAWDDSQMWKRIRKLKSSWEEFAPQVTSGTDGLLICINFIKLEDDNWFSNRLIFQGYSNGLEFSNLSVDRVLDDTFYSAISRGFFFSWRKQALKQAEKKFATSWCCCCCRGGEGSKRVTLKLVIFSRPCKSNLKFLSDRTTKERTKEIIERQRTKFAS